MAKGQDIVSVIKQQIEQFGAQVTMVDVGTVIEVGDGIARIHGLAGAKYNELLQFPDEVMGIALNLEEDSVAAVILGDDSGIKEGDEIVEMATDKAAFNVPCNLSGTLKQIVAKEGDTIKVNDVLCVIE